MCPAHLERIVTVKPRICLIAEDEIVIGMDLDDMASAAGFEVRWFTSMERAMASLNGELPDVAIIDVHLRDGPCVELARRLKQHAIPFIVHSGQPQKDQPPDLMDVPWLSKPANPAAILAFLRAVNDATQERER